jgi:AmpD protein
MFNRRFVLNKEQLTLTDGWFVNAKRVESPYFNARPTESKAQPVSLLVIHNISLPPNQFGSDDVERLFPGNLDPNAHPFFETIKHLQVSSHLFIRRDGKLVQFVSLNDRAWHAGKSSFQGRSACNDYSIGIELEGTDDCPFTNDQYTQLEKVTRSIQSEYPAITFANIVGHSDIAPGRKTDPGPYFDWPRYRLSITQDN